MRRCEGRTHVGHQSGDDGLLGGQGLRVYKDPTNPCWMLPIDSTSERLLFRIGQIAPNGCQVEQYCKTIPQQYVGRCKAGRCVASTDV